MELNKEILETTLKGVNDLESHRRDFFEIKGLNYREANLLHAYYLFGYRVEKDISKDNYKVPGTFKLTISKFRINQRR